jgi:O-acetyl-ADP-ribose deacetylase (regulator of RNase III)
MIIETIKGDLLQLFKEGKFSAIAHGANCFSTMGAGIAKQIAEQFPEAYEADVDYSHSADVYKLGYFSSTSTEYGAILNFYTQFLPGPNFEYTALRLCLDNLEQLVHERNLETFILGLPLIGCGIGKGNETVVKDILEDSGLHIILVEYDNGETNMGQTEIDFTS